MALPKWEDLSPEEKKVYDDKVSNIVNIIEEIDPDGFMILTGANGGGKSLIRSQFGLKYQKDIDKNPNQRKCKSISMQLRTSSNPEWGAFSSAMHDDDMTPTSLNTFQLIEGVFKAAGLFEEHEPGTIRMYSNTGFIIIDEPEIGLSEEMVLALCGYLLEMIPKLKDEKIGLMIITHSRLVVETMSYIPPTTYTVAEWEKEMKFINLDGLSRIVYLERNIVPANLDSLRANYLFDAVRNRMREVKDSK